MKKLLFLLLIPFIGFSQALTEIDFEGFHYQYNFILENGNILNVASVDLDNNTSSSLCQCTEYQFEERFWVFETNENFEIINERCFSMEDFQLILNENWVPAITNDVFPYNCSAPNIYDVFYVGDDIVFHLLEDSYGYNYYYPGGSSVLIKFDLETFNFYDPIQYPTQISSNQIYTIVDKTFKIVTPQSLEYYMNLHYRAPITSDTGTLNATYELLQSDGYQDIYIQNMQGVNQYAGYLTQIFAGNSTEVILDYKQNSAYEIAFLVVANSLDGLYTEGVQYETSLFLIEVDFTDLNNLQYNVIKSGLEIPYDTDLKYEDYNTFVDNNNNFVLNIDQAYGNNGDTFSMEDYNKLHFLSDDGSFESIALDNDFTLEWESSGYDYYINPWSQYSNSYPHDILEIAFSDENFMTLEKVMHKSWNSNTGDFFYPFVKLFKVFDYDGTLLQRYLLSYNSIVPTPDVDCITTIIPWPGAYWYDTFDYIVGVDPIGSGYLVKNLPNTTTCSNNFGGSNTLLKFTDMTNLENPTGPTVFCNDLELTLESGTSMITIEDLDNGSYHCEDFTLEIYNQGINYGAEYTFDSSALGENIIQLVATDISGNSSYCDNIITVQAGMGIDDNTLANISIYPNPTSNYIYINNDIELEAVVYDILGKQVMREYITDKLDISCLEKGTYIINLTDGVNTSSHKIIKN